MSETIPRRFKKIRWIFHETRSMERIREHYELEKRLATRLKNAGKEERRTLYTEVYDELMTKLTDHFYHTMQGNEEYQKQQAEAALKMLRPLLRPDMVYLEIGPGDCNVAFTVAKHVKKVYGVDVSHEITKKNPKPDNFELIISDGTSIPVEPGSVDLAYSNQLMEHIHPDDAREQLANIFRALKPGGSYLCRTPNALSGPHDISVYFDDEATCFHLKEYTYTELQDFFREMGFRSFRAIVGGRGIYLPFLVPLPFLRILEGALRALPNGLRKAIARTYLFRFLLNVQLLATK